MKKRRGNGRKAKYLAIKASALTTARAIGASMGEDGKPHAWLTFAECGYLPGRYPEDAWHGRCPADITTNPFAAYSCPCACHLEAERELIYG